MEREKRPGSRSPEEEEEEEEEENTGSINERPGQQGVRRPSEINPV
jgi:hypothetical protein